MTKKELIQVLTKEHGNIYYGNIYYGTKENYQVSVYNIAEAISCVINHIDSLSEAETKVLLNMYNLNRRG